MISLTYQRMQNKSLVLGQIVAGSLLIALCAQIRIPLPFTPVPITLQTLAVMLVGGALGSRNGALSVLLYLAQSMMGLPVLSGGHIDPAALIGPAGGYLASFIFQAYLVGWFMERKQEIGPSLVMLGIALSCVVNLSLGALWLGNFAGFGNAFKLGVLPFIPGEICKSILALNLLVRNDRAQ